METERLDSNPVQGEKRRNCEGKHFPRKFLAVLLGKFTELVSANGKE